MSEKTLPRLTVEGIVRQKMGVTTPGFGLNPERDGSEAELLAVALLRGVSNPHFKVWHTPTGSEADRRSIDAFCYDEQNGIMLLVSVKAINSRHRHYSRQSPSLSLPTLQQLSEIGVWVIRIVLVIQCEDYDITHEQFKTAQAQFNSWLHHELGDGGVCSISV